MQMKGIFCSTARLHAAHEALAKHRAHRAAHEIELEGSGDDRHGLDGALHDNQRIALAGRLVGFHQAIRVGLGILEFQAVDRHHLGTDLEAAFRVEQQVQALARIQAVVVAALGANLQVVFEVGRIEHRLAGRALAPQAFGQAGATLGALLTLDLGG
jgi:hypothetical protein